MQMPQILGTWSSPPYQITLTALSEHLLAEAHSRENASVSFKGEQIHCGIFGDLSHQALISKIATLGKRHIAVCCYPKERPTEVWVFEATKMAGLEIMQGKEYLQQTTDTKQGLSFYEKALKNFETALKLQQGIKGNTAELELAISQLKKERDLLKWNQVPSRYLPNEAEVSEFESIVERYGEQEDIVDCFEELLSIENQFPPHYHFMSAIVHEKQARFLEAMEDYLCLSDGNPHALACIEKAYAFFEKACQQEKMLLSRRREIRIAFEQEIVSLGKKTIHPSPSCFICYNPSEEDVGHWLEKTLVPDLERAGVKPIAYFRDLNQGQYLTTFHEGARQADLVILICTPNLKQEYEKGKDAHGGLAQQISLIKRRSNDESKANTVFPIFLKGTPKQSLPNVYFEDILGTQFPLSNCTTESFEFNYFSHAFALLAAMRHISPQNTRLICELFVSKVKQILRGNFKPEVIVMREEEKTQELQNELSPRGPRRLTTSLPAKPSCDPLVLKTLRSFYEKEAQIEYLFYDRDAIPIACAPRLALVLSESQQAAEQQLGSSFRDNRPRSFEDLYNPKDVVALSALFNAVAQGRKSLILGRAGIGKTTLCKYIAHQWENLHIPFSCVLWIRLNRLHGEHYLQLAQQGPISMAAAIHYELFEDANISLEKVEHLLNEKALLLLDGYDEFSPKAPPRLKKLLQDLLDYPRVILTSRPYALPPQAHAYTRFENIGFLDSDIRDYSHQFFSRLQRPDLAEDFIDFLTHNQSAWGAAHIPLNLELICSTWCEKKEKGGSFPISLTLTSLYTELVFMLSKRYLMKRSQAPWTKEKLDYSSKNDIDIATRTPLRFLSEVAFEGLADPQKRTLIGNDILQSLLKKLDKGAFQDILMAGFLKGVGHQTAPAEQDYYFLHWTIQDFFAARYLIKWLNEGEHASKKIAGKAYANAAHFIQIHKTDPSFEMMLSFAAGLLSHKQEKIEHYLGLLTQENSSDNFSLETLDNLSLFLTTMGCLEEANIPETVHTERLLNFYHGLADKVLLRYPFLKIGENISAEATHRLLGGLKRAPQVLQKAKIMELLNSHKKGYLIARFQAIFCLAHLDPEEKVVQALIDIIQANEDPVLVSLAMGMLGTLNQWDSRLSSVLETVTQEHAHNSDILSATARTLGHLVKYDSSLLQLLLDILLGKHQSTELHLTVFSVWEKLLKQNPSPEFEKESQRLLAAAAEDLLSQLSLEESASLRQALFLTRWLFPLCEKQEREALGSRIMQLLFHLEREVRQEAIESTRLLWEKADALAPSHLLPLLRFEQSDAAAEALAGIYENVFPPELIDTCYKNLEHPEASTRQTAAELLILAGRQDKPLLQVLRQNLHSSSAFSQRAADLLIRLNEIKKETTSSLIEDLYNKEASVRLRAVKVLGTLIKVDEKVILQQLLFKLEDEEEAVRLCAVKVLGTLIKVDEKVILQQLLFKLEDEEEAVRESSAIALGNLTIQNQHPLITHLIKMLGDKSQRVRNAAVTSLQKLGKTNERVRIASFAALKDEDCGMRGGLIRVLGGLGKGDESILSVLIGHLNDPNPLVKQYAAEGLANIEKESKKTIEALVRCLNDPDAWMRLNAATALGNIGKKDESTIEALAQCLKDPDIKVRRCAATALGKIGKEDANTIEALVQCLEDPDKGVKLSAAEALGKIGKEDASAIEALVRCLEDPDKLVRERAVTALCQIGKENENAIEALVRCLKDPDAATKMRRCAAETLGKIGKEDASAIDALVRCLEDPDTEVRQSAAKALGQIGKEDKNAIDALVRCLEDPDKGVRHSAATALFKIGKEDANAIEALVRCLKDPDTLVRECAATALGQIGKEHASVIEALVRCLEDPDKGMRARAATALGQIGKEDKNAIDALVRCLEDPDTEVRQSAAETLGTVGKEDASAIEALVRCLEDPDAWVRGYAATALGQIGKEDANAIEALVRCLEDPDAGVRGYAATALGNIGKKDESTIEALVRCLEGTDARLRARAAIALGQIGKEDANAIEALVRCLKDPDAGVRGCAAKVLGQIGKEHASVIEALVRCLEDPSAWVRQSAAKALGKIGNGDESVIEDLALCLDDQNILVRHTAVVALERIRKPSLAHT